MRVMGGGGEDKVEAGEGTINVEWHLRNLFSLLSLGSHFPHFQGACFPHFQGACFRRENVFENI